MSARRLCSEVLDLMVLVSSLTALTQQKPEITPPDFSTVQVADIFQKLVRVLQQSRAGQHHRGHRVSPGHQGGQNLSEPADRAEPSGSPPGAACSSTLRGGLVQVQGTVLSFCGRHPPSLVLDWTCGGSAA